MVSESYAQFGYYNDAILFGRTSLGGSTRMQSIGGAQVSLGGDISSAQSNPAGLGFYNRSEFSFTPSIKFQTTKSSLNGGDNVETFRNNFDIGNIGVVFHNNGTKDGKIKSAAFAITVNKINDFNDEITYSDYNDFSSILFSYADNAQDFNDASLGSYEYGAFQTYMINPVYDNNDQLLFYDPINLVEIDPDTGEEIYSFPRQEETIRTSGSQYQWNFAAGANYNDKLYFGATLGFVTLNYERIGDYRETEFEVLGVGPDLIDEIRVRDELDITGNGVNGTFGLILRPVDFVTVGVSYETPTFYALTEESSFFMTSRFAQSFDLGGETVPASPDRYDSDIVASNYNLRTPSKLNVGTTIFLGKQGFISGDVEFVDYASARIRSTDFSEAADNNAIEEFYKSTVNYRIGGEYRLDVFRFRGGYGMMMNPYTSDLKRDIESYSFGMGYRQKKYFVDLGVVNTRRKSFYSPYTLGDGTEPLITSKLRDTRVMFTLGFNF